MGTVSSGFSAACCATRPNAGACQVGSFPELSAKEREELQTSVKDKAGDNAWPWSPVTAAKPSHLETKAQTAPGQRSKCSTDGAAQSTAPSAASEVKDTPADVGSAWWFSASSQPAVPAVPAEPADVDVNVDLRHKLFLKTFKHPHHCSHCDKFLWGFKDQGHSCQACKKVVCLTCIELPLESLGICTTMPLLQRETSEISTDSVTN